MRNTSARFSANLGRLLILLLVVSMLATCFTGCFEYDPLGKETGGNGPAFDPDGDDEPDQPTDATDATDTTTGSTEGTEATDPTKSTEPTNATDPTKTTEATEPTTQQTEPADDPTTKPTTAPTYADPIAYGMVTADELNVRQGPGTNYTAVGKLYFNTRVAIYARNGHWGQTSSGWISLNFVYIDGQPGNVSDGAATITGDYVHVRSGPGTEYGILRVTREGDKVTILHIVEINNRKWGCTSNGWICMDYVELEKDKPAETEPATGGDDNTDTDTGTDTGSDTGTDTGTDTGNDTGSDTTAVDVTGTWSLYHISDGKLRVEKHIFKANGRYTNSVWFYEEVDETSDSNLTYDGKYWFGEPSWGWDGSYSVSGSTVTMVPDAQDEVSGSTIFGSVSGNTLTVDNITFTKE